MLHKVKEHVKPVPPRRVLSSELRTEHFYHQTLHGGGEEFLWPKAAEFKPLCPHLDPNSKESRLKPWTACPGQSANAMLP